MNLCACYLEAGCFYTTSGATTTIGFRPHSCLITYALYPLLCKGTAFFSSRDSHVTTSKIRAKFSISLSLIFSQTSGLHIGWPLETFYFLFIFCFDKWFLRFELFFLSFQVRKINFNAFVIFLLTKNYTIFFSSFSWWQYIASLLKNSLLSQSSKIHVEYIFIIKSTILYSLAPTSSVTEGSARAR